MSTVLQHISLIKLDLGLYYRGRGKYAPCWSTCISIIVIIITAILTIDIVRSYNTILNINRYVTASDAKILDQVVPPRSGAEEELFPLRVFVSTSPLDQLNCSNLIAQFDLKNGKEVTV